MFGVALLTSTLLVLADARIYGRCELARDFLSLGISKEHLATWVCIAYHESRFDTAARNPYSGDHGLLQISELYWCGVGKACGLPCSALRDDDISDDVECALRVHEEHTRLQGDGFLAWVVYAQHCKHNAKKYLADCDSSVKTSSVRPAGRARVMKVPSRNTSTFSYNPKIDELLPPYLTVNSFLRGNYEKEFEQNYNSKVRFDWLNYKIDNIDDLKLPVFNEKVRGGYTMTTLAPTTTTTPSPLPNIKPPSPRRIESNSFRRRMMRPTQEPVKFSQSTDHPITTTTVISTIAPRNVYKTSTEYNTTQENFLKTITTIKPSTNKVDVTSSTTSSTPQAILKTTKLPVSQTSTTVRTTTVETEYAKTKTTHGKLSTVTERSTQEIVSTTPSIDKHSKTKTVHSNAAIDKTYSRSFDVVKKNKSLDKSQSDVPTSTLRPSNTPGPNKIDSLKFEEHKSQITSTTPRTRSRTWFSWRTSPAYKSTTVSTTSKPSTRTWRVSKHWSSPIETVNENISSLKPSSEPTTTRKPSTTTRNWRVSKSLSSQLPTSISTRNLLVQSTTAKPRATWPAANSQSTLSSATAGSTSTTRIVTSTETPTPTTARTTQSIFDLYLNPTKRPKLPTFSIAPFKSNAFSLRIFAGGTTTLKPFMTSEDPQNTLGEAAKNQIRRQAWQYT